LLFSLGEGTGDSYDWVVSDLGKEIPMSRRTKELGIAVVSMLLCILLASVLRRREHVSSQETAPQIGSLSRLAIFDRALAVISAAAAVTALFLGQQSLIMGTSAAPGGESVASPRPTADNAETSLSREQAAALEALAARLYGSGASAGHTFMTGPELQQVREALGIY
jgi:hypothetical protein